MTPRSATLAAPRLQAAPAPAQAGASTLRPRFSPGGPGLRRDAAARLARPARVGYALRVRGVPAADAGAQGRVPPSCGAVCPLAKLRPGAGRGLWL